MSNLMRELQKVGDTTPLTGYIDEIKRLTEERDELLTALKLAASRLSEVGWPDAGLFDLIYRIEKNRNV